MFTDLQLNELRIRFSGLEVRTRDGRITVPELVDAYRRLAEPEPEPPSGEFIINKEVIDSLGHRLHFQVPMLVPHSCYWVAIRLSYSNWQHNAMMITGGYFHAKVWHLDRHVELYCGGYEEVLKRDIMKIFWFQVLKPIEINKDIVFKKIVFGDCA